MSETKTPYTVQERFSCVHCGGGHGRHFIVVGPDDIELGAEFEEEAAAEEYAGALNAAFEAGRQAATANTAAEQAALFRVICRCGDEFDSFEAFSAHVEMIHAQTGGHE